ncbi:hypothetical protein CBER1_11249 [Cercospora berteroae]|uniref:BHLH domain-containing protein n=1 Tax=Cercospora berteroae TaxID=357750 RepID=A0A2S6CMP7_9PEZI|nr:hypothetical protein CBER1_11249 [Cercospora berteroae]
MVIATAQRTSGSPIVSITGEEIALLERLIKTAKSQSLSPATFAEDQHAGAFFKQAGAIAALPQASRSRRSFAHAECAYDRYDDEDDDDDSDYEMTLETPESPVRQLATPEYSQANGKHSPQPNGRKAFYSNRPHAAVERRYRSTVNQKIQELQKRIPDDFDRDDQTGRSQANTKGAILDRAARYIQFMVQTYEEKERRCQQVRCVVERWLRENSG